MADKPEQAACMEMQRVGGGDFGLGQMGQHEAQHTLFAHGLTNRSEACVSIDASLWETGDSGVMTAASL